ncbi:Serine/threonine-protein phosphatase 2A 55 kDa regulatory subunit B [Fasciola hepatica]|uniref:Serine/threonine-protein phosphatase 2A 55 kDa regulatory subunit B n=1 Tax=Fasciola hepatica TaxID=6192 RepID=A0A4E0RGT1_FASHE|nr:Serine/threonine-protein phosphatase 2A 55 kDa regulatory subunit B [Fasciola hepatica]
MSGTSYGDNFTCVEYNDTGELLAVGDKGGRVTVFKESSSGEGASQLQLLFTVSLHFLDRIPHATTFIVRSPVTNRNSIT